MLDSLIITGQTLLHMARHDGSFTSDQIAQMLGTNSAVVRRSLAGLREAGLVRAVKGHHGGWRIGRELSEITLFDVHRSIGSERLFTIGSDNDHPQCAVEAVVNKALADTLVDAERQLMARFSQVTLEQLSLEFDARCIVSGWDADHPIPSSKM
ncbi:Rrf2 family transcriptional regulator [Devosia sp. BK]|uniref:Rrf2 family transcriptional regulator n=1 Tax=Devosia sp. BK TaxID=2871706 RepID=UPI002939F278|nr:Rrf2 family transcriptional regulator [Devosia sp. BK]MDV3253733.1 Rrf2 family transcriptional regulator [Devosia sp. BK]